MFGFIKKELTVLSCVNPLCAAPLSASLKCVSMNNQKCKVSFSIKTSRCSGICNNINDAYGKMGVPDAIKNINFKIFNLMSRTNETRHTKWQETCKCQCRLDASVCNNKQRWNEDKCKCECEELIDKGVCDKGFICNPSNCECECDKSCDVGAYLDYENCKLRKRLLDKLVEYVLKILNKLKYLK